MSHHVAISTNVEASAGRSINLAAISGWFANRNAQMFCSKSAGSPLNSSTPFRSAPLAQRNAARCRG
jgi:hypothetical protein